MSRKAISFLKLSSLRLIPTFLLFLYQNSISLSVLHLNSTFLLCFIDIRLTYYCSLTQFLLDCCVLNKISLICCFFNEALLSCSFSIKILYFLVLYRTKFHCFDQIQHFRSFSIQVPLSRSLLHPKNRFNLTKSFFH